MIVQERGTELDGETDDADAVRVGIVDDDQLLLAALGELLADVPGFELAGAASTVDAGVALAAEGCVDVLVVDVRMPAGGGVLVATGAQLLAPHTAVIALSASKDEAAQAEMAAAGAVAYLVKDASIATLLHAIEEAARRFARVGGAAPPC
ncbi:MAG: response regulator [Acidimicrobiia bacterium]|nr:response regulator [Acidimicrobiia bacterium]